MKQMKRVLALVLALVMSLGLLAGCGGKEKNDQGAQSMDGGDIQYDVTSDGVNIDVLTDRAFTADGVVFNFEGDDITGEEMTMFLMFGMDRFHQKNEAGFKEYGMNAWQGVRDDETMEEALIEGTVGTCLLAHVTLAMAEEAGFSMTDAQKADRDQRMAQLIKRVGEGNLENAMFLYNTSELIFDLDAAANDAFDYLVDKKFGSGVGKDLSDEAAMKQAKEEMFQIIESRVQEQLSLDSMQKLLKDLHQKLNIAQLDQRVMNAKGMIMMMIPDLYDESVRATKMILD